MSLPLPHPFKQAIRLLIHAVLEFGGLSVSGKIAKEAGKVCLELIMLRDPTRLKFLIRSLVGVVLISNLVSFGVSCQTLFL